MLSTCPAKNGRAGQARSFRRRRAGKYRGRAGAGDARHSRPERRGCAGGIAATKPGECMISVAARLKTAGIQLPRPSKVVGLYAPAVRTGNLLVVSGHGPLKADRTLICGRVGEDITIEQ